LLRSQTRHASGESPFGIFHQLRLWPNAASWAFWDDLVLEPDQYRSIMQRSLWLLHVYYYTSRASDARTPPAFCPVALHEGDIPGEMPPSGSRRKRGQIFTKNMSTWWDQTK